jgi:hypothetical protein
MEHTISNPKQDGKIAVFGCNLTAGLLPLSM